MDCDLLIRKADMTRWTKQVYVQYHSQAHSESLPRGSIKRLAAPNFKSVQSLSSWNTTVIFRLISSFQGCIVTCVEQLRLCTSIVAGSFLSGQERWHKMKLTMRYANKAARKATLIVGECRVPVIVDAHEIINVRDRRSHYEGRLWSTEMPISASFESLDRPLSLVFPNGDTKVIRVFSRYPTQTNPPSTPDLWEFFEASFIAEDNVGKS